MIIGIGVDIVDVERIRQKMNIVFLQRFLRKEELEYFKTIKTFENQVDYIAKLWAIKEACVKAWPDDITIFQVTILKNEKGYALKASGCKSLITVSRSKGSVVAMCVLEENCSERINS